MKSWPSIGDGGKAAPRIIEPSANGTTWNLGLLRKTNKSYGGGCLRLIGDAYLLEVSALPRIFPTTETIASMAYKSAVPIGIITMAGTHLVVHGTNRINGR